MNDMPAASDPLPITDIKIFLQNDGRLRAFAAIILADCFKINGLKIIEGKTGLFVAMPSRKTREGAFQDIAHPINSATRAYVERVVLRAYRSEGGDSVAAARELGLDGPDPRADGVGEIEGNYADA